MGAVTRQKAQLILREGMVRGSKLTPAQRRYMGARASGAPAKGLKKRRR